jgi:general secretion pathway protein L
MSRVIGVDLRKSTVRLAVVRSGFRSLEVEAFAEASRLEHPSVEAALRHALANLGDKALRVDAVVAAIGGATSFLVPLEFPKSAERRIDELVPFELEAELPIDLAELTYGYQILKAEGAREKEGAVQCLVASARRDQVQSLLATVREGLGFEAERVGVSSLELGGLVHIWPFIGASEAAAVIDIGEDSSDICLVDAGTVRGARTLGIGYSHFPTQAATLVAQVRQTLSSHASKPAARAIETVYLVGEGAAVAGIHELLASGLEVRVTSLGAESARTGTFALGSPLDPSLVGNFGRALGIALHAVHGPGFDLRRGPLAFSRGYGYLKERAPLLLALGVTILLSFVFATWAEGRALDREHEMLAQTLSEVTRATFDEATDSPDEARALMDRFLGIKPEDPMPYMDGFGAAVALSKAVPGDIVHDIELFDFSKGKLKLRGLVGSTDDAQRAAKALGEIECIHDPKVTKITQVVNSDRARYLLEADIRCPFDRQPEEAKKKPGVTQ